MYGPCVISKIRFTRDWLANSAIVSRRDSRARSLEMDSDDDVHMADAELIPSSAKGKGKATDDIPPEDESLPW